jgi:hypothetical protein
LAPSTVFGSGPPAAAAAVLPAGASSSPEQPAVKLSAAAAMRASAPRRLNGWLWFMTGLIEIGRSA